MESPSLSRPRNFRPAHGCVWAEWSEKPGFIKEKKRKGKRADGLRYERKAHKYLDGLFGEKYVASPWIRFIANGKSLYCQPDGLVVEKGLCTIVEIKLKHTAFAWFQIKELYLPVLKVLMPDTEFNYLEVCRWFDSDTGFPGTFRHAEAITQLTSPSEFFVHIWNGR